MVFQRFVFVFFLNLCGLNSILLWLGAMVRFNYLLCRLLLVKHCFAQEDPTGLSSAQTIIVVGWSRRTVVVFGDWICFWSGCNMCNKVATCCYYELTDWMFCHSCFG